jgi:hypothetical protein
VHWVPFSQLWEVPFLFLGAAALLSVWLTRPLWYDPDARQLRRDLLRARQLLEQRDAPVGSVPALLADALNHIDRAPARAGEVHFLLGTAYQRLADQLPSDRQSETRARGRDHLEKAEALGVPESDVTRLRYRLGKVWFQTGVEPRRVIDYLAPTIEQAADDRGEGYAMLTQAYLHLSVPDVRAALQANEKQLQQPIESESVFAPARLLRGELLLRLGERDAARKVLAKIGPRAPSRILARARHLQAMSYQDEHEWAKAAPLWEAVLNDHREPPPDPDRVWYFLGLCRRNQNHPGAARAWEQVIHGGETAQAAQLRLALLRMEKGDFAAALNSYETALASLARPAEYNNSLVERDEARGLVEAACRICREKGKFAEARQLALLHSRLAMPPAAQLLLAEVAEGWGKALHEQAQREKNAEAAHDMEAAVNRFREAGAAYEAAAEAALNQPDRADWLWHAAMAHLQAQDFNHAIPELKRLLELPAASVRFSEAWYRLARAYQAVDLEHEKDARDAYVRCIEQAGPFAFRARHRLAEAEIRRKNWDDAEAMLLQNLELMRADADRAAHERTLYSLADVLFGRGEYRLAATRWEQALSHYPGNPEALSVRYRLGEAYRRLAEREFYHLRPTEPLGTDTKPHYWKQYTFWMEKAASQFQMVADNLAAHRSAESQNPDAALLLKALFAHADCRFELHQYGEAARLYDDLAQRYVNRYEALVALKQLWSCYVLPPPLDQLQLKNAIGTLRRTTEVLGALPDSVFKGRPESESRIDWEGWIRKSEATLKQLGS